MPVGVERAVLSELCHELIPIDNETLQRAMPNLSLTIFSSNVEDEFTPIHFGKGCHHTHRLTYCRGTSVVHIKVNPHSRSPFL